MWVLSCFGIYEFMYKTSFKDLIVWRKSIELVKEIYRITDQFPSEDRFVLVAQMRRAALSIPSNIAEGKKRKGKAELLQFFRIADGSAAELESQLIVATELYSSLNFKTVSYLLQEIQKMLCAYIKKLL